MSITTRFGSSLNFIFAVSASAVGLGNVWRFPYLAGENGGGLFVLMYIGFVIVLGLPLMMSEMSIGRLGRGDPYHAFVDLHQRFSISRYWRYVGMAFLLCAFLILSYYVVVSGWVLNYVVHALPGNMSALTQEKSVAFYQHVMRDMPSMMLMSTIVCVLLLLTMMLGLNRGLEPCVKLMFPLMLVIFIVLMVYALKVGDMGAALHYLFVPDVSEFSWQSVLSALGQAFFSLGLGMGVLLMYSAYLPEGISIGRCALIVVIVDTVVALIAGLVIFPVVFAHHLPVDSGPGLIFKTLPLAFAAIPFGSAIALAFFLALLFAAFTSLVSLMEPLVAFLQKAARTSRVRACTIVTLVFWLFSLLAVTAFARPEHFAFMGVSYYDFADFVSAKMIMPVGGLLLCVMAMRSLPRQAIWQEMGVTKGSMVQKILKSLLIGVVPVLIALICLASYI